MAKISSIAVSALIVVPLLLTAVVKYAPMFGARPEIRTIAVMPPRLLGEKDLAYLQDDVGRRLGEALQGIPGIEMRPSPAWDGPAGNDVTKLAASVGADALVMTAVTADSGLLQLNVRLVEAKTGRLLYSNPFQSAEANYPEMTAAAGAALRRELLR
jgi:hypothetical protein